MHFLIRAPWPLAVLVLLASTVGCGRKPAPAVAEEPAPRAGELATQAKSVQAEVAVTEAGLTESYRALEARRKALPPGDANALAAFNRDAAIYTEQRKSFTARQADLTRLQQAQAEADRPALELLTRLRAAIAIGDYPLQARMMNEALQKYRNRPAFAAISATARAQLERVNLAMIQRGTAANRPGSAAAAPVAATGTSLAALRALINASVQPGKGGDGRVGVLDFHLNPGLAPLDYANVTKAELMAERQTFPTYAYIRPKAHPQLLYRCEDIEFNLKLKHYYQDQTLPTKRLSEIDYDRIIALCREIAKEGAPAPEPAPAAAAPAAAAPAAGADPEQTWAAFQRLQREWPQ